jgi:hypothetical protein
MLMLEQFGLQRDRFGLSGLYMARCWGLRRGAAAPPSYMWGLSSGRTREDSDTGQIPQTLIVLEDCGSLRAVCSDLGGW